MSVYRGKYYQHPFVERKAIPFYIYDENYNTFLITTLIEKETPTLFVFCYLNAMDELELSNFDKTTRSIQTNADKMRTIYIITELEKIHLKYNKS
jgi:hypothetical protein